MAKWVGLVVCVVVGAANLVSLRWVPEWWFAAGPKPTDPVRIVAVQGGALVYVRLQRSDVRRPPDRPALRWNRFDGELFTWPSVVRPTGGLSVTVPLWMPFVLLAVLTSVLWYVDRTTARRRRAGQCLKCGYDRAGLAAGARCPECGAAGLVGRA